MIGNLGRRSEQTKKEAVHQNGHSTRRTLARLAFADHMDRPRSQQECAKPKRESARRNSRSDHCAYRGALLGSAAVPQANSERDLKSSSPLQKHEPPQEPSAQHLAKAGRGQFPMLFRAGFRRRALPNQTNHLAGLRLAGLRDPGSHHLCMEHSAKPSHRVVA